MMLEGADHELEALLNDRAIRTVLNRYVRGVDRRDEALLRSCYHPDAIDNHGTFVGGIDEFAVFLREELPKYRTTMHLLAQSTIEYLDDAQTVAAVETYSIAVHRLERGPQGSNWRAGFRYVDRFERRNLDGARDETWKIADRTVVGEWMDIDDVDQQRRFPKEFVMGLPDHADPIYAVRGSTAVGL